MIIHGRYADTAEFVKGAVLNEDELHAEVLDGPSWIQSTERESWPVTAIGRSEILEKGERVAKPRSSWRNP